MILKAHGFVNAVNQEIIRFLIFLLDFKVHGCYAKHREMNERLAKRNEGKENGFLFLSRISFKSVIGSTERSEVNPRAEIEVKEMVRGRHERFRKDLKLTYNYSGFVFKCIIPFWKKIIKLNWHIFPELF